MSSASTPTPGGPGQRGHDSLLIVGTGAMACLFAARLAEAGVRVTMLGTWAEGIEALRTGGVCIVDADGLDHTYSVEATADPATCGQTQFALVLVKSWQTGRAARQLRHCLSPQGLALTLQNGIGNREKLLQVLGADRVALGVTTSGATLLGPGRVVPRGEGLISLGQHPNLAPLADLLRRAGFSVQLVADSDDLLWSKLVVNAAINPLTALLRVTNGQLLDHPEARSLMAATARETAAVAGALGMRLAYPDPVAAAEAIARLTARNTSSMLQDIRRGAPTEIDAICGAVVAAGDEHGIPVPVNRTLWLLIRALARKEN